MAQRRMFSKDITENDAFLDMPLSTQALYFHLGMQADDDGFVSPNRIVRMLGCQADDLKILVVKKFVLQFDDGVVVLKHWKINNYLRNDRYKSTPHKDKLAQLSVKSNGGYKLDTIGIPVVDAGKVRIGKVRIGKDIYSSSKMSDTDFDTFWETYPRRVGKAKAKATFLKLDKELLPQIMEKLEEYSQSEQWQNPKYIPHPTTWLNQGRWEDEVIGETLEDEINRMKDVHGDNTAWFRLLKKHGDEVMKEHIKKFDL